MTTYTPSAKIRIAPRAIIHVAVSPSGRLQFRATRRLPAVATLAAIEKLRRLWSAGCRGGQASGLPRSLRAAAAARASGYAVERALGYHAVARTCALTRSQMITCARGAHARGDTDLRDDLCRRVVGADAGIAVRVFAYSGESPHREGRSGGWYTRGGTPIRHPSAYRKVGWSNAVYCIDTREVRVGELWLASRARAVSGAPLVSPPPCRPTGSAAARHHVPRRRWL